MADRYRAVANVHRNRESPPLALGAIARLSANCGATAVEDHFSAKVGIDEAPISASKAREDALALAAQVFNRLEQIAARHQRLLVWFVNFICAGGTPGLVSTRDFFSTRPTVGILRRVRCRDRSSSGSSDARGAGRFGDNIDTAPRC